MKEAEIAVVGGGASGLMAALTAAEEFRRRHVPARVLVLEGAQKPGKKLLATGNGRCNLTNRKSEPFRFHGDTKAAATVLGNCSSQTVVRRFQSLGLLCREEDEGRVYPNSGQAASVLSLLMEQLESLGGEVACDWYTTEIIREKSGFRLRARNGEEVLAQRVILAASGKAAPQLGSDGSGYALAQSLGHSCTPCFPALVPVICKEDKRCKSLKGARCRGTVALLGDGKVLGQETGEIQFTEYGLSGICVFQLSRMASEWSHFRTVKGKPVSELIFSLDLLPEQSQPELLAMLHRRQRLLPKSEISDCLAGMLHLAMGRQIVRECLSRNGSLETLSPKEMETLLQTVKEYRFIVKTVQDWSRAQVTAGGVPLKELSGETLESLCCPGLYLCGELLNIDGDCGGYNLQWAWASGMTAGKAAAGSLLFSEKKPRGPKNPKAPQSPKRPNRRRNPHAANR